MQANTKDEEFYALAERKLDALIERIGRPKVARALAAFERGLSGAQACCGRYAGDKTSCLWHDHGCGHACLERYVAAGDRCVE